MKENSMEKPPVTAAEAIAYIQAKRQECMVMGANDSESGDFDHLLTEVNSGRLSPEEAMKQANDIREGKMEYR